MPTVLHAYLSCLLVSISHLPSLRAADFTKIPSTGKTKHCCRTKWSSAGEHQRGKFRRELGYQWGRDGCRNGKRRCRLEFVEQEEDEMIRTEGPSKASELPIREQSKRKEAVSDADESKQDEDDF
uniref:Secreted protein n=1 Tax=Caenorhabditis elegans TaxID=6239 RepID=Q69Z20_CAEEL|eukprot:NP_001021531.1 Uncharacterized protein CELE_H31B20.2 [Caenorhabditis elegans]